METRSERFLRTSDFGVTIMARKRKLRRRSMGKAHEHHYCSGCKTRRGSNIGNRKDRHYAKRVLRLIDDEG